jgi:riboflavin kinase/FMN adenylyltransferase
MTSLDSQSAAVRRSSASGSVVSIGVFDGVHRGHQALLDTARERADRQGLPLVVITFDPHPMSVVGPKVAPPSLATISHRVELLREHGADDVRVLTFDEELSLLTPEEFVTRFLVTDVRAREVVVGEDFRFGHRAAGTIETLSEQGRADGFSVTPVSLVGVPGQRWSSTHARNLIESGDVAAAAAVPADGVYAGWLEADGVVYPAAISVGTNPQFAGTERRVESYVLDHHELDLYGHHVSVRFVDRIRGQKTFDGVEGLITQMTADVEVARALLESGD